MPEAHVNAMSIFDCERIRIVRDSQEGCVSLYFGRMIINVYGHDPYKVAPEVVEQTEREASKESLQIAVEWSQVVQAARGGT